MRPPYPAKSFLTSGNSKQEKCTLFILHAISRFRWFLQITVIRENVTVVTFQYTSERNTKNSQTKKEEKACQTVALVPHTLELHQSDEQHFIKLTIIVASVLTPSAPHSLLSHSRHVVRFVFLRKIVQSHRSDRLQRSSIVWIGDRREEGWKGHQGDVHR